MNDAMPKTISYTKFRITGGMKHGWIQEPHTYEVFFTDGTSVRVQAMTQRAAETMAVAS